MKESKLHHLIEPIEEMLFHYDMIIERYKNKYNATIVGLSCDMVPLEILGSFNCLPLRLPRHLISEGCIVKDFALCKDQLGQYDTILVPQTCCNKDTDNGGLPLQYFQNPIGYGNEHGEMLHNELSILIKTLCDKSIKDIDSSKLKKTTEEYNNIRRLVRGIAAVRAVKPDLLSNVDLFTIFDAASVLPPKATIDFLANIMNKMIEADETSNLYSTGVLLYGCQIKDPSLIDSIEESGCIVTEDDICNGRRQFDLSFNADSELLYYEILDAYSYKPLCPSIRPGEERYELFYKLLKNHGIDLVVFLENNTCSARMRDIDFLRKKLMRLGVDPIVVNEENASQLVADFIKRAG